MASIPNLNTLRTGRRGPRRRGGGQKAFPTGQDVPHSDAEDSESARDKAIQQTDQDASSSRASAVALGYLEDPFVEVFLPPGENAPKRFPIINRGTYVRTRAIDELTRRFLRRDDGTRKQVVSLGAGSDTRFFRFVTAQADFAPSGLEYHELDFAANVAEKRRIIAASTDLSACITRAQRADIFYRLHAIDLRDIPTTSPPEIPDFDPALPTLLLSECCLCYLSPDVAEGVLRYFVDRVRSSLALVLYEPIQPADAFGRTMVANLASRGIHLRTLQRFASSDAQRVRLREAGLTDGQGARDVRQLWESEEWVGSEERERVERLEWLDEVEEWNLLASHYCVAWGWKGQLFSQAWEGLSGD